MTRAAFLLLVFLTADIGLARRFFCPLKTYKHMQTHLGSFRESVHLENPIAKSQIPQELAQAVIRPQRGLPGTVNDLPPHGYRQQCREVRQKYRQALRYWNHISRQLSCYERKLLRGDDCEACLRSIEKNYAKVKDIYPVALNDRTLVLKYRWPLPELEGHTLKKLTLGSRTYDDIQGPVIHEGLSFFVDAEEVGVDYKTSPREACLEPIALELELESPTGEKRHLVTSYTF